jgi:hypothetical protein
VFFFLLYSEPYFTFKEFIAYPLANDFASVLWNDYAMSRMDRLAYASVAAAAWSRYNRTWFTGP